jgi:hypothetical protein
MAKQLAALLGGGLDLKALAEMLRRQGRGQDTILAHITPQEAALLKARGGAGTMNPATGLPEFQEEDYGDDYSGVDLGVYSQPVNLPQVNSQDIYQPTNFPAEGEFGTPSAPIDMRGAITETGAMPDYAPELNMGQGAYAPFIPTSFRPSMDYGEGMTGAATEAYDRGIEPSPVRDFANMLKAGAKQAVEGIDKRTGLGLGMAGLAALQARRGYNQARQIEQQLRQLGQAPREVGQQQLGAGMRGELTPVQQQQLAAFQAQQRQALANTGQRSGTAQQQLAARTTEMQQRGAQDLINQGLKNIGISDQYLQRAILAGYQADANVGSALAEALQAAGYMVAGAPSETPTKTVATPAQTQARTALTPPRG